MIRGLRDGRKEERKEDKTGENGGRRREEKTRDME